MDARIVEFSSPFSTVSSSDRTVSSVLDTSIEPINLFQQDNQNCTKSDLNSTKSDLNSTGSDLNCTRSDLKRDRSINDDADKNGDQNCTTVSETDKSDLNHGHCIKEGHCDMSSVSSVNLSRSEFVSDAIEELIVSSSDHSINAEEPENERCGSTRTVESVSGMETADARWSFRNETEVTCDETEVTRDSINVTSGPTKGRKRTWRKRRKHVTVTGTWRKRRKHVTVTGTWRKRRKHVTDTMTEGVIILNEASLVPPNPVKGRRQGVKVIEMIKLSLGSAYHSALRELSAFQTAILATEYARFLSEKAPFFLNYPDPTPMRILSELAHLRERYRCEDVRKRKLFSIIGSHMDRLKNDWNRCVSYNCMDCVINYYSIPAEDNPDYHSKPCDNPHMIIMVRFLSGRWQGEWPAKVMCIDGDIVTVEYFSGNNSNAKKIDQVHIKDCIHLLYGEEEGKPKYEKPRLGASAYRSFDRHMEAIIQTFPILPVIAHDYRTQFDGRVRFFTDENNEDGATAEDKGEEDSASSDDAERAQDGNSDTNEASIRTTRSCSTKRTRRSPNYAFESRKRRKISTSDSETPTSKETPITSEKVTSTERSSTVKEAPPVGRGRSPRAPKEMLTKEKPRDRIQRKMGASSKPSRASSSSEPFELEFANPIINISPIQKVSIFEFPTYPKSAPNSNASKNGFPRVNTPTFRSGPKSRTKISYVDLEPESECEVGKNSTPQLTTPISTVAPPTSTKALPTLTAAPPTLAATPSEGTVSSAITKKRLLEKKSLEKLKSNLRREIEVENSAHAQEKEKLLKQLEELKIWNARMKESIRKRTSFEQSEIFDTRRRVWCKKCPKEAVQRWSCGIGGRDQCVSHTYCGLKCFKVDKFIVDDCREKRRRIRERS